MTTAQQDIRFNQTYTELRHARPELFAASEARLAEMHEDTRMRQDAREFSLWLGKQGPLGFRGESECGLNRKTLVQALNRMGLERCLKREASHLLQVVEILPDGIRKVRLECWVGSFPDIKLTDWQKQYDCFAHRNS